MGRRVWIHVLRGEGRATVRIGRKASGDTAHQVAGRSGRMAAVEDEGDIGRIGPKSIEPGVDFLVDDVATIRAAAVISHQGFVDAVAFRRVRLRRAMAAEIEYRDRARMDARVLDQVGMEGVSDAL